MKSLPLQATMSVKEPGRGFTSNACPDGGDEHLREYYHSGNLPNAPSHSTNESKTAIFCNDQGHERAQCGQRQRLVCWEEGCNRQAEAGPMSREGEIDLFCLDHQSSGAIATRTEHCKFTGCLNTPKYGQQKGPLKFCQHHKRVGMYTNRNGQLLLATRDGSAFKDEDRMEAMLGAILSSNIAVCKKFQCNIAGGNTAGFGRTDEETNTLSQRKPLQMPVRLWSSRARNTGMSPAFGGMAATQQYRKVCEVPGCHTQPSYGPKGTTRPRFCSSHKKAGMVGLKNRPCNFPGCSTRPHYGLLGCRPIYCAKHKEPNMVHLLKEATIRGKMDTVRDLGQKTSPPPEPMRSASKLLLSVTRSKEKKARRKVPKKNVANFRAGDDQEFDDREATDPSPIAAVSAQVMDPIRTSDPPKYGKASGASTPLPEKTQSPRLAESLGMTPSFEKGVLKDVKKPAQAELTTSGSGKRERIPSRKALEASGKLKIQDTQWLTKEKKEEEARRMKGFRAQRKAAAAVGLKAGQVIETATVGPALSGEGPCTGESGGGDGAESKATRMIWRKLSPAEILEVAAKTTTTNVIDKARPGGRGDVASGAEDITDELREVDVMDASAGTTGAKRKEGVWTPQGTLKAITPKSDTFCSLGTKRWKQISGDKSVQLRQAMPYSDRKEPGDVPERVFTGENTVIVGAGDVGEMKVCQYEDCSKRATFGVNGIERYCKLHALFGMHRINVQTYT